MGPDAVIMPPRWHLGNDIVDLTDPRHMGKSGEERFLQRVFSEEEREDIRSSRNPDRALWARWAGKEAAFKTISKSQGTPPVFIHSLFEVTLFRERGPIAETKVPSDPPMTRFGHVRYEDVVLPLRIEAAGTAFHAVTWTPSPAQEVPPFFWGSSQIAEKDQAWREVLRPAFTALEWACVSHRASALARLAARSSLATTLGVDEEGLEIGCGEGKPGRRIPKVFFEGEEAPVDLTLSHHGRLLAWAFLTSAGFRPQGQFQGR